MQLATADYIVLGVTLVGAVLGLFGGFSGALAFLAGVGAASRKARRNGKRASQVHTEL